MNSKKRLSASIFLIAILAIMGLGACSSSDNAEMVATSPRSDGASSGESDRFYEEPPAEGNTGVSGDTSLIDNELGNTQSGSQQPARERIVIKNGSLYVIVDDVEGTMAFISGQVLEMGGWIVNSDTRSYTAYTDLRLTRGTINVRVPAARLEELVELIKKDTISVESETITGQDVTAEFIDLESRLRNLEAAEEQLQSIMDGATTTEDVLKVYNQLVAIRGDIEVIKGRLQSISEMAAYSSLFIDVSPPTPERSETRPSWQPGETFEEAFDSLLEGLRFLVDAVIWIVVFVLPFAAIFGVAGLVLFRLFQRFNLRKPGS